MTKREFVKPLGALSALSILHPITTFATMSQNNSEKNVLILGGRGFIGPRIVESSLSAGYQVTLLNRRKTNTQLFKDLPIIIYDREKKNKNGLLEIPQKYQDQYWDIVIDTWQKSPKTVADFLDVFQGKKLTYYSMKKEKEITQKWLHCYV